MTPAGIKDVECKSCGLVLESKGEDQRKLEKPVGQGTLSYCRAACRLGILGSGRTFVCFRKHSPVGPKERNTVGQDGNAL